MSLHLKNAVLSKRGQTQNTVIHWVVPFICIFKKEETMVTESRSVVSSGQGKGEGWTAKGLLVVTEMCCILIVVMVSELLVKL